MDTVALAEAMQVEFAHTVPVDVAEWLASAERIAAAVEGESPD